MGLLRYVTHPQVRISREVPIPRWGLSDAGRSRAEAFATRHWLAQTTRLVSSSETKALETAAIVAVATGLQIEVREELHENDRSASGFVPHDRFGQLADAFFANPSLSVEGWETAVAAQARVAAATEDLLVDGPGDILVIGHGAVGTLLMCALSDAPIDRSYDQLGGDAALGGGNYWTFDRQTATLLHGWRATEAAP